MQTTAVLLSRLMIPLLALSALSASAEIYKWVDEKGQVHYSDEPPPDQTEQARVATPIYKWVDKNGKIHYGDDPPADQTEQKLMPIPNWSSDGASQPGLRPEERRLLRELEQRLNARREQRKEKAQQAKTRVGTQDSAYRRKQCTDYTRRHDTIKKLLLSGYESRNMEALVEKEQEYAAQVKEYCE